MPDSWEEKICFYDMSWMNLCTQIDAKMQVLTDMF